MFARLLNTVLIEALLFVSGFGLGVVISGLVA